MFPSLSFNLLEGYQCAPPNFPKPAGKEHGQYCQAFKRNHKDCGGESKSNINHSVVFILQLSEKS